MAYDAAFCTMGVSDAKANAEQKVYSSEAVELLNVASQCATKFLQKGGTLQTAIRNDLQDGLKYELNFGSVGKLQILSGSQISTDGKKSNYYQCFETR